MAITVSPKNYTQISSCDTLSSGGTWGGVDTIDSADKKEGAASLCGTLKGSGDNDIEFTPSAAVDLSGIKHVRFWFLITSGSLVNLYANGGIQFWASDGTNTGYWYVGGRDTYPGGWYNFVVDVSKAVDAGTKPTNMNAITSMGTRHNLTSAAKNVDNTWIDNLCVCDGLITYGDDAGGYYDFNGIYDVENNPSAGGWGILTKKAGTFCLVGSIEFGDSAGSSGTKFQAKSQGVTFENRPNKDGTLSNINSNLMNFTIVDNGIGTTEFILGEKSGTQGISGCTIRTQDTAQIAKFDIDGSTDTDVDNFKLYGSTFLDADSILLPANVATSEVLNCNFEKCGQVVPDTCVVKYCNFISSKSTVDGAVLINDDPHYVTDCSFISCPDAVEMDTLGDGNYDFNNLLFSGNTYDVNNTCGSSLTVTKVGTSDPSSYNPGGNAVTFAGSVTITITVVDKDNTAIENAQTAVYKTSDNTQLMNEDTNASGVASESYTGSTPCDVYIRVRKSSTGATKYIAASTTGTIVAQTGLSVKITLQEDTNA